MDGFFPALSTQNVNQMNMLALAHVGDAVYELLVRSRLCMENRTAVTQLHRMTVSQVNAAAQAQAAEKLFPVLTDEERSVYKRGRNAKVNSVPHHAEIAQYHAATGLEALFGWLYLLGRRERLEELFARITEE
jgi:ribonuclease-3 family protein